MIKHLLVFAGLLIAPIMSIAQLLPPGGDNPPDGYSALSDDWWYKIEYEGRTITHNARMVNGQIYEWTSPPEPWSWTTHTPARNSTPYNLNIWADAQGKVRLFVRWRHGQNPAPPKVLRLKMSAGVSAGANCIYTASVDSGIGLPVVSSGPEKHTEGAVLRKLAIDGTGEGRMEIDQKVRVDAYEAYGVCGVHAPHLSVTVDPRDVEIQGVNGNWPRVKGGDIIPLEATFPLPQDQYWWFREYLDERKFSYTKDLGRPAPVYYPSDATDESEWHLGLLGDYQVHPGLTNFDFINPLFTGTYSGSVVAPEEGDPYSWTTRFALFDGSDTQNGVFSTNDPLPAVRRNGTYKRPVTIKYMMGTPPSTSTHVYSHGRDAGKSDPVKWTWQWQSDGLRAESRRNVVLHYNAELNGQESDVWDDVRVEAGYQITHFVNEETNSPEVRGWVTRGNQECRITERPGLRQFINVLGPIFSAGGPAGAIIMALSGIEGAAIVVVFACIEAVGALLDLMPGGETGWTMHRYTVYEMQCDSLRVAKGLLVDLDGNGSAETLVHDADFKDETRLLALKEALSLRNESDYYWRMKHRLRHKLKYEMFDQWDGSGYKGSMMRDNRKEMEIAVSYFHMEFHKTPDPVVGF